MFSSPVLAGSAPYRPLIMCSVNDADGDMQSPTQVRPRALTFHQAGESSPISPRTPDRLRLPLRTIGNRLSSPVNVSSPGAALYDPASCETSPWRRAAGPILPTLSRPSEPIPRVSCATVAALLQGQFTHLIDRYVIVDCRYAYEHGGGHIPGSININRHDSLVDLYKDLREGGHASVAIIFHCEFSQSRGPRAFNCFRKIDRDSNMYPLLSFPQMFLMEGGYRAFHENGHGIPMQLQYVPMDHPELSKQWKSETSACRKTWDHKRKALHERPPPVPKFKRFGL